MRSHYYLPDPYISKVYFATLMRLVFGMVSIERLVLVATGIGAYVTAAKVNDKNLVFQQLKDTLAEKADVNQVPTTQDFQQLTDTVATKADVNPVPTTQDSQQLTDTVATKADVNQVPTTQALQQLTDTVATKAD